MGFHSPSSAHHPPVSVFFGPVYPELTESSSHIRQYLSNGGSAGWLDDTLQGLPFVWEDISSSLVRDNLNLLLVPVTVLRHIVEFQKLKDERKNLEIRDVQGFCVGVLAAITACWEHDDVDFAKAVSTVLRVALCIGALVDLDELHGAPSRSMAVRWKTKCEHRQLGELLERYKGYIACMIKTNGATVTVPSENYRSLTEDLESHGISVKSIPLRGRFHTPDHIPAMKQLLALCAGNPQYQLPIKKDARLLPRSNVDGTRIPSNLLIAVAVESILAKQANWMLTVAEALNSDGPADEKHAVIIGAGQIIPQRSLLASVEHIGNQMAPNDTSPPRPRPAMDIRSTAQCNGTSQTPMTQDLSTPIAVTGFACRYPQADSVEALWTLLERGQCTVSPMPNHRLKTDSLQRQPGGPFWGNFLKSPGSFDHRFFGVSAREAESMDPQQRLLLQVAYEAMESATYCGLRATQLPDDIGCYVGVGTDDYSENVGSRDATAFSATGTLQAFNTGRISHFFGWTGPSITVDTACSSAAVAIHLACQALHTNDCSIAVAGGVNVMTDPRWSQNLAAASFLSPTGASKAFDAAADGYCRGEGAGLLVLRPLNAALCDGDPIHAVITGTCVNQGANCSPITVPDSNSQRSLYTKALAQSGMHPDTVSYVEAHGTGTQVGDPIEYESIRSTFGGPQRTQKLHIGSIKDNIGHTETSSGAAGMLKTILMIQKRRIPKQANFSRLNSRIVTHERDQIAIPTQSLDWKAAERVALVTNYGAAGSNAAIVIKEPGSSSNEQAVDRSTWATRVPFIITAKTEESLREYCRELQHILRAEQQESPGATHHLAYNLAAKQNRGLEYLVSFSCEQAEVSARLQDIADGCSKPVRCIHPPPPVVLCFGGQTGDTASISPSLVENCDILRSHLTLCDEACDTLGLPGLFPTIFSPEPRKDLVSLHCILFSIQYASAKAWLDCGLVVNRMIGHSFGQLTAICVAGGLSLIDGLRLISQRAALIQEKWGSERGVMLSLKASEIQIQELLRAASDTVDVACFNGPQSFVLAGDEKSIAHVETLCVRRGLQHQKKRLRNTHAFHSRLVDPLLPGLSQVAQTLDYRPLRIPVEACSEEPEDWARTTPSIIARHSRDPVYFHPAVQRTLKDIPGPCVWLEAGSGSPIVGMVRRVVEAAGPAGEHTFLPMDLQESTAVGNLADVTKALWSKSVPVQFWPFHRSQAGYQWINLPPYQFSKTQHWIDYDPYAFHPTGAVAEAKKDDDGLLRLVKQEANGCLFRINNQDPAYRMCTEGHAVVDQNLCPASLYVEIVVRGAIVLSTSGQPVGMAHIEALNISAPLVVDMPGSVSLRLSSAAKDNDGGWMFSLFSQDGDHPPIMHASGKVSLEPQSAGSAACARFHSLKRLLDPGQFDSIAKSPSSNGLKRATVYQAFRRAVNYADYYRGVEEVYAVGFKAAGRVLLPASSTLMAACDPILMDNFLQVAGIHVNCLSDTDEDEVFVCSSVGEVSLGDRFLNRDTATPKAWTVYSTYERESEKKVTCDVFALDEDRALAMTIMSATFTSVSIQSLKRTLSRLNGQSPALNPSSSLAQHLPGPQPRVHEQITPPAHITISDNDNLRHVQAMLGELLGVLPGELPGNAPLVEIGVDSLMSTEVLAEVDKRFGVKITNSELADIADVRALAHRIFPSSSSVVHVETSKESAVAIDISIGGQKPIVDSPPVVHQEDSPQFADSAITAFVATRGSTKYIYRTQFGGFCTSAYPRQMQLVTAYVVEAFQALGAKLDSILPGQTIPTLAILPQHTQVLGQLISVLEYAGFVERMGTEFVRTSKPVDVGPSAVLHQAILGDYPQHASEHKLLHTTGARLAECLTGTADPLSLLFQDAQARALMQEVYSNAPMFKSATIQLAQYLQDLLLDSGCDREIEILEIGAGTGGTTAFLVSQLAAIPGVKFNYTFTDLSSSLVTLARKRFASHPFMRYSTLDIEKNPPEEVLGKYDIILSSNCIHATRSLATSCTNIWKMLRRHGILCLIELTRNLPWFDLVFGLLEGWWLFNDGRSHALASERLWDTRLREAGFNWVDWTDNALEESDILRLIVASPTRPSTSLPLAVPITATRVETVTYAERDGLQLMADIYYPHNIDAKGIKRPIALLIHGGGHIMLSRKDIRPAQVDLLLDAGFLPVSIDYRLCPEVSLLQGPMPDVRDALAWARADLPHQTLSRSDIQPDGDHVVAVGWSTGGHLAMTLSWTAPEHGIRPPQAILAFYGPTDYTDPFWTTPNFPYAGAVSEEHTRLTRPLDALHESSITAYNPPANKQALGGWMAPSDPRSQIALYMNWTGQTLSVLFNGCQYKKLAAAKGHGTSEVVLPAPPLADIQRACPLSQIVAGRYRTPTFLIHGSLDDLIPVEQAQRTQDAMRTAGLESTLRVVKDGLHLFDLGIDVDGTNGSPVDEEAWRAVCEGYEFLRQHVDV
ncbi:hypothetical protein BJX66DRAFT_345151 [Aspergillus keveii]|uniref:Polyketide synthase n=1 Tax=Aspergillus keveii TaxID=714993 RepID=A0ABR4FJI9_9EURO